MPADISAEIPAGISGGMGTLSISIYYKVECDPVFDLTKHMPAVRAYNISGQTL